MTSILKLISQMVVSRLRPQWTNAIFIRQEGHRGRLNFGEDEARAWASIKLLGAM